MPPWSSANERRPGRPVGWRDLRDAFRFAGTLRHPRPMSDESTWTLASDV